MEKPVSGSTLKVIPLTSSYVESNPITRASYLPDGYVNYTSLDGVPSPQYSKIAMFMVPERTTPNTDIIYQLSDPATGLGINEWNSTITVTEGTDYYMYGFMPRVQAVSANISPLNDDYAKGATITINNFNTLTPADVCAVVGVRKATTSEETSKTLEEDIQLGSFSYRGGSEDHNSAFVLLKHIYSGMRFKIQIDPQYHKLRSIRVKKVELKALNIPEKVNLRMTLRANTTGTDPLADADITYTNVSSTTQDCTITLFPWEGSATEFDVPETVPQVFLACFAPAKCSSFVLISTYDVYDRKKNNLIRSNCTAENKLNSTLLDGLNNIKAGDIFNINLLLKPTYLYVLSEPDLDNPTIVVN